MIAMILLKPIIKIKFVGIKENALNWIKNILCAKKENADYQNVTSSLENIACSVKKEYILWQLLTIYENDSQYLKYSIISYFC